MKRIITVIFALSLIFILSACNSIKGNGNVVTEDYNVRDFNRIEFSGVGELIVTVGERESLSIRTDENLQEVMEIEVRGNTLHIGQRPNTSFYNPTELVFTVTVPELEALDLSGAGSVFIDDLEGDSFSIDASGAADVEINDIDVNSLTVEISGAGSAIIYGRADELDISISGAGDFSGYDLEAENAQIEISGAGSAEINASDEITGEISGAGNVAYRGNPSVDVDVSGAGSVSKD